GAAARGRAGAASRRVCWSPARSCHVAPEVPGAAGVPPHSASALARSAPLTSSTCSAPAVSATRPTSTRLVSSQLAVWSGDGCDFPRISQAVAKFHKGGPPRLYTARFRPELIHFRPATGFRPASGGEVWRTLRVRHGKSTGLQ